MKKYFKLAFIFLFIVLISYGLGRLYYYTTAGFTVGNITSDFAYQPQWETRPLTLSEDSQLHEALNQPYHYLSKGCQSYVFASEDSKYVIKFFKYQRYRLPTWLSYCTFLPAIKTLCQEKKEKKWHKLDGFVQSWKVAFENLKEETGLVYVHLNKTTHLNHQLTIHDKIGSVHQVELDQMEFCIQQKAQMLCDVLLTYKADMAHPKAYLLIDRLLSMITSEYERGLADNDHALMQNTGVAQEWPVHIDVGQFVFNDEMKNPLVSHQELFTKMYKFKLWLQVHYPEAYFYLDTKLNQLIGPAYSHMQPKWRIK